MSNSCQGYLQAVFSFKDKHKRLPKAGCDEDAAVMVEIAKGLGIESFGDPAFTDDNAEKAPLRLT